MKESDFYRLMYEQEICKRKSGAESTADLYRVVRNRLKCYCRGKPLTLRGVTALLVSGFRNSLEMDRLCTNTVNSYISNLRAMYNRAVMQTGLRRKESPFKGVRLKYEETAKRSIPLAAVERIAELDLSGHPHLQVAADMALFSFMACGMPFADLVRLTGKNISKNGKYVIYRRKKTNAFIQVEMNRRMKQIVSRYRKAGSSLLFPVLPKDAKHEEYKALLSLYNRHLKKIGNILGISEPLTSYVFRHSWASAAYRCNVRIGIISQALGHGTEQMTRNYLSLLDPEEIASANHRVVGKVETFVRGRKEYPYL